MPSPADEHSAAADCRLLPSIDKDETATQCKVASTEVPLRALDKETTVAVLVANSDSDSDTDVKSRLQPQSKAKSKSRSKSKYKPNTRKKSTKPAEKATSTSAAPTTAATATNNGTTNDGARRETEEIDDPAKTRTKTGTVAPQMAVDGGPHKDHQNLQGNGPLARVLDKTSQFKMGLFSRKKAAEQNPYADQPFSDPKTPYQQARNNMAQGQTPVGGLPSNPRAGAQSISTAPPSYRSPSMTSNTSNRFANEQYGAQGGYGSDKYGGSAASPAPARGASGYGGFDDDAGKGDLFGNAGSRYVPPQQNSASPAPAAPGRGDNSNSALFGDAANRYNPGQPQSQPQGDDEYGGYGAPRELTAEEQEDQELANIHDETKQVRQQSKASTQRSIAIGNQAIATGLATYARLGEQGERLNRTERKLDEAAIHSKDSEDKTKELKKLNGSMFVPVAGNPFTRGKRERAMDKATLARHQEEKGIRSETLRDGYTSNQMVEEQFKDLTRDQPRQKLLGAGAPRNNRLIFDEGEDDDAKQDEEDINNDVDAIEDIAYKLKGISIAQGQLVDKQIGQLGRITEKTDAVDDRVRMNREKLNRIR